MQNELMLEWSKTTARHVSTCIHTMCIDRLFPVDFQNYDHGHGT